MYSELKGFSLQRDKFGLTVFLIRSTKCMEKYKRAKVPLYCNSARPPQRAAKHWGSGNLTIASQPGGETPSGETGITALRLGLWRDEERDTCFTFAVLLWGGFTRESYSNRNSLGS